MTRFPTAGHLVSWAKYAPRARQSAGKSKPGTTGKGNPWLASTLGEAGIAASRTQDLPRLALPPARPPPRQAARPGRGRQLHPHHRLAPAVRPRNPLHRPRPWLARPARPDPPQATAHRRTRTAIQNEGHPPGRRRLTSRPTRTRLRCAPPGAAARPAKHRFRFRRVLGERAKRTMAGPWWPCVCGPAGGSTAWLSWVCPAVGLSCRLACGPGWSCRLVRWPGPRRRPGGPGPGRSGCADSARRCGV
jgi:hypothetical protein